MLAPKFSLGGVDMPWRRKSSPTIIGPSPSKVSLLVPHSSDAHSRARWLRLAMAIRQRYDGYNFVLSKEPVCSERLNEGSFA